MRLVCSGHPIAFMAAALVLAAPAMAGDDAPPPLLERIYLEQTGFAVWAQGPRVKGLGATLFEGVFTATPTRASRQLADDGRVEGWGGGVDGRLGVGFAEGWAIELGGSYLRVDQNDSDGLNVGDVLFAPFINGAPGGLAQIALGDVRVQQDLDAQIDLFDARLGVARDVTIYAEGFSGKARLGLVGGRFEQDYRIDHRTTTFLAFSPDDGSGSQRIEEDLDSWFLGPYLGLSLVGKLTDRIRMTLDADLAFLYNHADLDASQRIVGRGFTGAGLECGFLGVAPCEIGERDEEEHFSARPRVRAGLDFDFGPFVLGVTGGITYWSYAPQVVNPELESIDFATSRLPGSGAAHVGGDDLFLADVGVHLTIPLGAPAAGEDALAPLVNNLYLEQTGHAVWMSGPRVRGLGTTIFEQAGPSVVVSTRQLDDDGRVEGLGGGWDGRVGVAVAEGWDVELGGSFARVDQKNSSSVGVGNSEFMAFPLIDGLAAIGYVVGALPGDGVRIRQEFEGEVDVFDARLAVAREVKLAERVHGKVRLGIMGGRLEQDYRIDQRTTRFFATSPVEGSVSQDIDEELDSWFLGPYLGMSLAGDITRRLRVTLDADMGLLYNQADLDASQHFVGPTFPETCGTATTGPCDIDEKDSENHFSFRPRARLSVDFDLGPLILGVTGGFTWWSYAPQVVNPQLSGFASTGPGISLLPGSGPAHVGGDDLIMADVGVRLTFPFGRR